MKCLAFPGEHGREPVSTRARHAASLATLLGIAGTSPPSAAEPACAPMAVDTDAGLSARWPDLQGRVRQALAGRDDVDACARITIRLEQSAIVVKVVLPDGRAAFRSVSRREDVVPTLEALLLLPRERARAEGSEASRPVTAPAAVDRTPASAAGASAVVSERAEPLPTSEPELARRVRIELSVVSGARVGNGQMGASLGVLTSVDIAGWLVGFMGAADHYEPVTGGPAADALKLAASAGRRFRFGDTTLDLTAGPALALHGIGSRFTVRAGDGDVPATGTAPPPMSDLPELRIHCAARVSFRARAFLRPFAGLDGEFGQARPVGLPPGEPRLPMWTAGLVLGASVGTP
jgi:hypothetical protein